MNTDRNVFISWSGERSRSVAKALRAWLPIILQAAKPWMSDTEIEKGSRGISEITRALAGMRVAIRLPYARESRSTMAGIRGGRLSKSIDDKSRLCTYLFGGLSFQDVKPPLSMFQATRADKEDTRKLIHSINKAIQDAPVSESDLDELFDAMWPSLEKSLNGIAPPDQSTVFKRPTDDMVAEILDWARTEPQRRIELASDITDRIAASKSASGPTIDLAMNLNGKPLTLAVTGLPELLKPALMEVLREQVEKKAHKILAEPRFDELRGTPELRDSLKQSVSQKVDEIANCEVAEFVESGTASNSRSNTNEQVENPSK